MHAADSRSETHALRRAGRTFVRHRENTRQGHERKHAKHRRSRGGNTAQAHEAGASFALKPKTTEGASREGASPSARKTLQGVTGEEFLVKRIRYPSCKRPHRI
ncbi:Hypothetical protein NTJ_10975 [Nesidiocoris tenuis]|uniref:Protein kinase domain-containing protein n=1 Tax=Nesidiocoris tenuis TaxID=355587 RepID=A0ABN7B4Q3_9HEMI|nr:Hypothetical protein NTJ_10975 [Nesidiocoris tenuis]